MQTMLDAIREQIVAKKAQSVRQARIVEALKALERIAESCATRN